MDYTHTYQSPLGELTLASDGTSLVGLWFEGDRHFCSVLAPEHERRDDLPAFREADRWLDAYFAGREPGFLPPVEIRGSEFRRRVCRALLDIPYGETRTYGEVAARVGTASARAVGGAVGSNPVSIIIPCHRVVGASGGLTGYGGGIRRKVALLELEGVDMSHLTIPRHGTAL